MYARIARFEGGTAAGIDAVAAGIREDLAANTRQDLADVVSRVLMIADREQGAVTSVVFCDTEEDLRKADRLLDSMSPPSAGMGHRVSVDLHEVVLDESLR